MIGNDIIDLQAAAQESRINRKGFLEKLFLPIEIDHIRNSHNTAAATWLLWSCKEAAYKTIHRFTRERKYAPQRFSCELLQQEEGIASGKVLYDQHTCYFRSSMTTDYVHTYAAITLEVLNEVAVFTRVISQPADVASPRSAKLIQESLSGGEMFYKDEEGVPYIRYPYSGGDMPVSVSHHGRYFAAARLKSFLQKAG